MKGLEYKMELFCFGQEVRGIRLRLEFINGEANANWIGPGSRLRLALAKRMVQQKKTLVKTTVPKLGTLEWGVEVVANDQLCNHIIVAVTKNSCYGLSCDHLTNEVVTSMAREVEDTWSRWCQEAEQHHFFYQVSQGGK